MTVKVQPPNKIIMIPNSAASTNANMDPEITFSYFRGPGTFSVRGQRVNIFGLAGHVVSIAVTQLCFYCKSS